MRNFWKKLLLCISFVPSAWFQKFNFFYYLFAKTTSVVFCFYIIFNTTYSYYTRIYPSHTFCQFLVCCFPSVFRSSDCTHISNFFLCVQLIHGYVFVCFSAILEASTGDYSLSLYFLILSLAICFLFITHLLKYTSVNNYLKWIFCQI